MVTFCRAHDKEIAPALGVADYSDRRSRHPGVLFGYLGL